MALPTLTPNALVRIHEDSEDVPNPVLQIIQLKRMNPDDDNPRFKLAVTDGCTSSLAMATNAAADKMPPFGKTDVNSIVKVTDYQRSLVSGKKIIILLNFELLMPGSKVGCNLLDDGAKNKPAASVGAPVGAPLPPASTTTNKGQVSTTSRPQSNYVSNGHQSAPAFKNIHPIESLTPYQNKWCIRARVTNKNPIKNYKNARGEGKLFSVDLADSTGEIRATGFNQECDRFYDTLKEGEVYYIRGGQIKSANKQFSSLKNDYELTFSSDTQIDPCHEEVADKIPLQQFNFVPFDQLENKPKDALIDVIGVLDTVSQLETFVSKQSQIEHIKRNIRLIDNTQCSVALTLWAEEAQNFDKKVSPENLHPIVAVKGVKISDFQGLSLSKTSGGKLFLNPDHVEAHKLRGWYDNTGGTVEYQNLSNMVSGGSGGASGKLMLIALADAERLGTNEKPDFFSIKAIISALKRENCLYKACPTTECNKKLIELGVDSYRCEKCTKEFSNFKWRLMLQVQLQDFSGQLWVTFFEEMAQQVLGCTSEELGDLKKNDEDAFNSVLNKCLFKSCIVRLKAKMETFNDETRVKFTANKIEPLKYDEYIRVLQEEIKKMELLPSLF